MAMEEVPRGPIQNIKSGSTDFTDNYKTKLKYFRNSAREQALQNLKLNKEWANLSKYINSIEGSMWPKDRPKFRSGFVDNHMSRARKETMAQYMDVRPTISVSAQQEFIKQSDILKKLLEHTWLTEDLHLRLAEVLDHGMFSVGYWKVNGASGRVSVLSCGMDTVLPINDPGQLQFSSAILYRTFKPNAYFFTKWGKDIAEKVLRSSKQYRRDQPESNQSFAPLGMTEYSWNRLSPSMRYVNRDMAAEWQRSSQMPIFPVSELEEFWIDDFSVNESSTEKIVKDPRFSISDHNYWYRVKPGERMYPRKRLMIFGGDESLYDSTTPYWYEGYPFAKLVLDPIVWGAGGMSKYRPLLPINKGMNEISAGVFDTVKKAINQAYVAKRGSVLPADWDRFFPEIPGQKMLMNNTGDIRDVRALDPPNLPAYVFEFSKYLLSMFDRHAGSMNPNMMLGKKQVPGGDTIEQIRDSQSAPIRLEGSFTESFLRDAGKIAVSHYIQFFNRKDRFNTLGADGVTLQDYEMDCSNMVPANQARESFWKRFRLIVAPGSLHGASKDRDQMKALTLFKMGALSLETLLRKAEIGDVADEIKRIMEDRQAGRVGAPAGRTPRMSRGQRNGQAA